MRKNSRRKIIRSWLEKAEDDLAFAKAGFKEGFYNQVCLLCQQAVEKYLKAYLVKSKGAIKKKEKIHDLPKLASLCKPFGLDLEDYYVQLRILSGSYLPVRYPDASFGKFGEKEARESLEAAEEIIKKIKDAF